MFQNRLQCHALCGSILLFALKKKNNQTESFPFNRCTATALVLRKTVHIWPEFSRSHTGHKVSTLILEVPHVLCCEGS